MTDPLLRKLRTVAAKIETTPGTAVTLGAADGAFNAYDISIQPNIQVQKRDAQGSADRLQSVPGVREGTLTFKTDLGWDGTVTLPTWATVLLPLCGYVESSQVFTPRTEPAGTNVKTATMGVFDDGRLKSIAGAVGTFRLVMPTGQMAYIEWTFQGKWQAVTDESLPEPTYPTPQALRFADATVQHNSITLCTSEIAFDAANTISLRSCAGDVTGIVAGVITDREPMFSIDPESTLVADRDPYGLLLAGTEQAMNIVLKGPTTSTITIAAPKTQHHNVQEGDREGVSIDNIELTCNKNGATKDESVSITFAEAV